MRQPGPRLLLNAAFVKAVRIADQPQYLIAQRCGFRHPQAFSQLLGHGSVAASSRNVARLQLAAHLIGYPVDEVFSEVVEPVLPDDAFDGEHLPAPGGVR